LYAEVERYFIVLLLIVYKPVWK